MKLKDIISQYLPFNVECIATKQVQDRVDLLKFKSEKFKTTVVGINESKVIFSTKVGEMNYGANCDNVKLVLRPLSDLNKKININGEEIVVSRLINNYTKVDGKITYVLLDGSYWESNPLKWSYSDVQLLLQYHFDVFGLIEQGKAVDINKVKL